MKVKCNKIKIGERVRKDLGNIDSLADSINTHGLLQPIGVTKDNELVFGERRLAACKLLNYEEIEVVVLDVMIDSLEALEIMCVENVGRRDYTITEKRVAEKRLKQTSIL